MITRGKFIVIMGIDGCGKSTICNKLKNKLGNIHVEHWRPNLLPKLGKNKRNYVEEQQNLSNVVYRELSIKEKLFSNMRLLYYTMDFILGYFLKVRILMKNGENVVIERYYYDQIINPERYKFYSKILIRYIYKIIPKPEKNILLIVEPDIAFKRKGELNPAILNKYQEDYVKFFSNIDNKIIINTEDEIDYSVERIINYIG